jgi:anaerobic magnesium-protoporphyrin IX monomethyl ester cyclase
MADVLLTHSYHLFFDRKQVRKMQPYPPLGTLYAAALLRDRGISVALFDSMLQNPEESFGKVLRKHRPKIVVVYEDNFNFLSKMCLTRMRQVAFGLAEKAKSAGALTLVNGSDASDHASEYLREGFDYVLTGEAEWTLLSLANQLLGSSPGTLQEVPGLVYLDSLTHDIVRTPAQKLMDDLDALPFPAWDLVDIDHYRDAWTKAHGFFSLNMVSSRGCPYHCNWCAKPIYGTSYNARSPQKVAEEMRLLKERFAPDQLWFADDIFALKPRWTESFALAVQSLGATIPFKMQSRADLMSPERVNALQRAGCVEVWMGAESGSQRILNAMEKDLQVEQIIEARRNLQQHNIRACFFLQFGYAGESWPDIQETIDLVRRARPDDIGVSVSYPLPGTKFYSMVSGQLEDKTNWEDSEDLAMMFKGAYTNEFYRALHDALHLEVDLTCAASRTTQGIDTLLKGWSRLADLWLRVGQLETQCRNMNPTVLANPAHAESQASELRPGISHARSS